KAIVAVPLGRCGKPGQFNRVTQPDSVRSRGRLKCETGFSEVPYVNWREKVVLASCTALALLRRTGIGHSSAPVVFRGRAQCGRCLDGSRDWHIQEKRSRCAAYLYPFQRNEYPSASRWQS